MKDFPLYGALDIGSNAARILFANVIPVENELIVFKNSLLRLPIRLGMDVYDKGRLSPKRIKHLIDTLNIFSSLIRIYKPDDYAVYATAALREAENSAQVLGLLKAETDFHVNVIDGYEEARIIKDLYVNKGKTYKVKLMADLGGGSFELTVLSKSGDYVSESFKIGAVRALTSGISEKALKSMHQWLDQNLPKNKENVYFIGTGGNMNTLKSTFTNPSRDYIELQELKNILTLLEPLDIHSRIIRFKLRPDRADVIIPASKIFINLMDYCHINKVHIPGGGLSDGIILELHKKRTGSGKQI